MSRQELRKTFGEDAELYDRVRPTYPHKLYDDLAWLLGNPTRPRVLEIGPGTGQATAPMLKRGWSVKAVELSPDLARVARAKLPGLEVITADFESWELPPEKFDLVFSATAFHWIDPDIRVQKAADALGPGGMLAVISTEHIAGGSHQLFVDFEDCYQRFNPDPPGEGLLPADAIPTDSAEFDASGRFGPVEFRRYEWERRYTTAEYLDLLSSYSGHRALTDEARDRLYGCISARIDAVGGSITKRYLTQLSAANLLNQPLASS
ncbi:methyltransferase family protein [Kribbella orskensis]|uniref:Methyltransferase family protein n=1 Tax=Kribbella orskensis TaxID=2512216 RepID=A0ABY2B8U2_9ACTN|nr:MULTISPECIES: class I SAM-dependent methyltransferase [Kribbella]TCN32096.1 methyltransferase family protein [Kribbella sp. VKM Ac-2500]TCO12115.1 methyltransferase family protein [Kribbella orskensis]